MAQHPDNPPWDEGLQPERTTLAWVRTLLSFVVVSLLTARLARDSHVWALAVALSGTVVGSLLVAVQARSHRRRDAAARSGVDGTPLVSVIMTTALTVVMAALALLLVVGRGIALIERDAAGHRIAVIRRGGVAEPPRIALRRLVSLDLVPDLVTHPGTQRAYVRSGGNGSQWRTRPA